MYAPVAESLESRLKWAKCFQTKMPKNPTFWGVHTYMAYIRESFPGPDHFHGC